MKHIIYKATNCVNGKIYIGQTNNLKCRMYHHEYSSKNKKASDYNTRFHAAIRKYGMRNFKVETLCFTSSQEEADNLESFYIKKFNSYDYSCGYNMTKGGIHEVGNRAQKGEKNGRALLTKDDVIFIRKAYNDHVPFKVVAKKFENKISIRGLQKIWYFETWKDVLPEFNTLENKEWYKHQAKANDSKVAADNKRKFSKEEVKLYRKMFQENQFTVKQIHTQFCSDLRYSTVYNMIMKKSYKDIE